MLKFLGLDYSIANDDAQKYLDLKKNKQNFRSEKKQLKRILLNREKTWMAKWRGMEKI